LFYACAFIAIPGIDLSQYRRIFNNHSMLIMHLAICSQRRFFSSISGIPTRGIFDAFYVIRDGFKLISQQRFSRMFIVADIKSGINDAKKEEVKYMICCFIRRESKRLVA